MIRLVSVLVLVACGGRATPPSHPDTRPDGSKPVAVRDGHSDDKCTKLIAHALGLAVAERPAEQKLSDAERSSIETQLREKWVPSCRQMTQTGYDCVLAAHSLAAVDACGRS